MYYLLFFIDVVILILFIKFQEERHLCRVAQTEIVLLFFCTSGIIYELVIATSVEMFFLQENTVVKLFRAIKYLRIFFILYEWNFLSETKMILESTIAVVKTIKHMIVFWALLTIMFSIIGFNLFAYREHQQKNTLGVNFHGIMNSIIFTTLTFYNEEWDYLMFDQYPGSNGALLVIWQLISIFFGLTILSKYLMALLLKELCDKLEQKGDDFKLPVLKSMSLHSILGEE